MVRSPQSDHNEPFGTVASENRLVSPRRGVYWVAPVVTGLLVFSNSGAQAQNQTLDPMLTFEASATTVRAHVQGGLNAVSERNLFWNFSDTVAPGSEFDADADWLELYTKPGLSFEKTLDGGRVRYGKGTAVASYTLGTDAYDFGPTGRATLEEAYLGLRTQGAWALDVSLGPRELKLDTGMLVANGGSSGFERGALKFRPRKAWKKAAIGRISAGHVTTWPPTNAPPPMARTPSRGLTCGTTTLRAAFWA